jgi:Cell Wall Hydrolase
VIRNRVADPRFPKSACAVVRAAGEFQPVGESRRLRLALNAPERADPAMALADFGPVDHVAFTQALELAAENAGPGAGPGNGALYFVNPRFMEPGKCPWFAALKRTGELGRHVFMTHYAEGEAADGPALDCAQVRRDYALWLKAGGAKRKGGRRAINPAWIVEVEKSPLAGGGSCRVGSYDPRTRSYAPAQGC